MRPIEDIEADIRSTNEEVRARKDRLIRLRTELEDARIAESVSNPHPWMGKRVKRTVTVRLHKTRTERGTVKVRQRKEYFRICTADVGELIVVTDGGHTAYNFEPEYREQPRWELDQ